MAFSTTVSQRKYIKRKAPRGFLKRVFKRQKPHLRLETSSDLLVHLNCLLFVHRLAEESRMNAFENKYGIIKKEHVQAAAKITKLSTNFKLGTTNLGTFGLHLKKLTFRSYYKTRFCNSKEEQRLEVKEHTLKII
ncbi:unnamed protein product [Gulo gulo]|uniref:Centromere protein W n=1 Tax=Gulo gulo TaxID=48420 RepID=A0A9X9MAM4_GULGU|nr:unnamed protein product [Gulo gulo]